MPSAVKSLYELADKYFVPRDEIELWLQSAVKSLYELADKYFVPRDEIELWLQSHVKQYSCRYMVSSHEIEMFKESIEGIEDA